MSRTTARINSTWHSLTLNHDARQSLDAWMIAQANEYGLTYLLAYADDGVIWGKFDQNRLTLAGSVFPEIQVALTAQTLQQARLFGKDTEVMIWREGTELSARVIVDQPGDTIEYFDEQNLLWGTRGNLGKEQAGFTLLFEGRQDLRHAPPITKLGQTDRVALIVRHYLATQNGQTYIARARLVDLQPAGGQDGN